MSALGQKQTFKRLRLMSALPPKADIGTKPRDVRFVPKADICSAAKERLFDHFGERAGFPFKFTSTSCGTPAVRGACRRALHMGHGPASNPMGSMVIESS